jgi:hypothetical protein
MRADTLEFCIVQATEIQVDRMEARPGAGPVAIAYTSLERPVQDGRRKGLDGATSECDNYHEID